MTALSAAWNNRPRLVNNPVILRELLVRLRTNSSFLFLFILLSVSWLLILSFWGVLLEAYERGANWDTRIRDTFSIINMFQGLAVACMIPLISSTAINHERECETWDLLLTSPLNIASILTGKLVSSVSFFLLLLTALVPMYGIFFLSGGVSGQEVIYVLSILFELTLVISLIGIYASSRWKRPVQSITATYLLSIAYIIGFPFFRYFIHAAFSRGEHFYTELVLSPIATTLVYFGNIGPYNRAPQWIQDNHVSLHALFVLLLCCFLIFLTCQSLKRSFDTKPVSHKNRNKRNQPLNSNASSVYSGGTRFFDHLNPVMVREKMELFGKRRGWFLSNLWFVIVLFLSFFSFGIYMSNNVDRAQFLLFWAVLLPWLILPYAASSIRNEIDRNTFELLLTTFLTPNDIIRGKYLAGMTYYQKYFWKVMLAFFITILLIGFLNPTYMINIIEIYLGVLLVSFLAARFFLKLGIFYSSVAKKSLSAYASLFATVTTIYFVSLIFSEIIFNHFSNPDTRTSLLSFTGTISPVVLISYYDQDPNRSYAWQGVEWWALVFVQSLWMLAFGFILDFFSSRFLAQRTQNMRV